MEKIINKIPYVAGLLDRIEELENTVYDQEGYISMCKDYISFLQSENKKLKTMLKKVTKSDNGNNTLEEPEEVNVTTKEHELKTYNQKSQYTVRYYYKSQYLFSAPESYHEKLQGELNKILFLNPDLDIDTLKKRLIHFRNNIPLAEYLVEPVSEDRS